MAALVLHGIGDLRYERIPLPRLREGEALVRVAAVGICGSDLARVYQHGTYSFPLIPGHEVSGLVAETVGKARHAVGERVVVKPLIPCGKCSYCQIGAYGQCVSYGYIGSRDDGGFAEYARVPQANLVRLPPGVDLVESALCEPAAVALHAVRQGVLEPGDAVAILGTGPIGMLLAQWAKLMGAGQVLLVDIDSGKLARAKELELGATFDAAEGDPVAWVWRATHGRGADLVVEAAGVPATVNQALLMARPLGRVVLMGNPAADVTLPQATVSQILRRQLTIRGTWNSDFVALPVDEWQVVLDMVAAGRIDLGAIVSHRLPLSQGVEAMEIMRTGQMRHSRVVLLTGLTESADAVGPGPG